MVNLHPADFAKAAFICLFGWLVFTAHADKLVMKSGEVRYGHIIDERDSLVRYFDRHDRPRKVVASQVDSIIYDSDELLGRVKIAYRKGLPKDWTGYLKVRHSDELDMDVIYATDSLTELDLFFRNGLHVRILNNTRFQVVDAPKGDQGEARLQLIWGGLVAEGQNERALFKVESGFGVGTLRGIGRMAFQSSPQDSSVQVICLQGLVGVQEKISDPGEFVVETGADMSFARKDGLFRADPLRPDIARALNRQAENMGHYSLAAVEYPPVGYLPRALTGLGFLVFFYGSTLGVLDYVNHL